MNDVCKAPEKAKLLIEKINTLSNEIIEYKSMIARLYEFQHSLKGQSSSCSEGLAQTEPVTFVDKLQMTVTSIRGANEEFSYILNELSELL